MSETIGYTLGISINATKPKVREAPGTGNQLEKKSKPKSSKLVTKQDSKVSRSFLFVIILLLIRWQLCRMMQRTLKIKTFPKQIRKEKSHKKENRKAQMSPGQFAFLAAKGAAQLMSFYHAK